MIMIYIVANIQVYTTLSQTSGRTFTTVNVDIAFGGAKSVLSIKDDLIS